MRGASKGDSSHLTSSPPHREGTSLFSLLSSLFSLLSSLSSLLSSLFSLAFNTYAKIARNQIDGTRDITTSARLTTFFAKLNKGLTATCQHKLRNLALILTPSAPPKNRTPKFPKFRKKFWRKVPYKVILQKRSKSHFFCKM